MRVFKLGIAMRLDAITPANCCTFCEGKDCSNPQTVDDKTQIKQLGDDKYWEPYTIYIQDC
ncbi:hypothetical protein PGT21_022274 [Puccinia graminis f. sp. tritici]|uniref:Uncharacterized protein n=1 Tax=Puccinia graminis f. sp. tritici TaxID=56615 RepID=A0A5B0Q2Z6_PUCGR|nr:hypothetical protein PGT21_022274 [Puccinia graminis f. sp. tritici]KAA1124513.1 hypothetical protein PGTUg99_005273 [Puccinia graminis f. sp. tritici]